MQKFNVDNNRQNENDYPLSSNSSINSTSTVFTDFQIGENSTHGTIDELKDKLACIPPGEALIVNMAGFSRDSVNEVVSHGIWYGLAVSYKLPYLSFERESIGGGN